MSIFYPVEVTEKSQAEKAAERLRRYKLQLDVVTRALEVIKKYEGKKPTAHIATAAAKAFGPAWRASFDRQYGMYHLNIWPADSYPDKVSLLLGYESSNKYAEGVIDYKQIEGHNRCYTLNAERIPRLEAGLWRIPGWVARRDKAIKELQSIAEEAAGHEMEYDFGIEK